MFTGLVQDIGNIFRQGNNLRVEGYKSISSLNIGDSIAVDGVCLTVTNFSSNSFCADISEETLEKTTLGRKLERNNCVNLESALRLSDRLGGHLVSGHVDGLGKITSVRELPQSRVIEVCWEDPFYGRYICEKGSICLNGISLTVAGCSKDGVRFSVAVIPHTWSSTSLQYLAVGELVNLEADLIAKYTESILDRSNSSKISPSPELSKAWLEKNGWS